LKDIEITHVLNYQSDAQGTVMTDLFLVFSLWARVVNAKGIKFLLGK